ncbi:hypothetical protein [Bradyrhizobium iriomotense]|uniref:hypothetical protein n=1 Tax=Bradyrhizobium iriomotense TaxID=441950 RepID=UPI001B89F7E2|nr:hypothetical protein [Bradyrhizobium iriomotense]MBR0786250.1 hypothetical protein [Bradyrhizobium iriomotense]
MLSYETCVRTTRGWLGGCLTATAVIELFLLFILALPRADSFTVPSVADFGVAILIGVPAVLVFVCVLSGIPSAVAIWLSERFCIRSLPFFVIAGGLAGVVSQTVLFGKVDGLIWLFVVAGCFAGLAYWHIAGRYAGERRLRSPH